MASQRPDGGVTYLYKDETERLALESSYNALINVQRETLDSLKEGVAVFGTDGRLRLHNSAFSGIWKLSPQKNSEPPHIDDLIRVTDDACHTTHIRAPATRAPGREPECRGHPAR